MRWFAAHVVMIVRHKSGARPRIPVWENVVLIAAKSEREALAKAEAHGRRDEGDDDGSFVWGGKPAQWEFAGVRKVTECAMLGDQPGHGDEITFTELELDSDHAVEQFVAGKPARVLVNERYRTLKPIKVEDRPKRPRRKQA